MRRLVIALGIVTLAWASLGAQSDSEVLKKTVDGTLEIERRTQKNLDDWSAEEAELLARYRTAKANVAYLRERIAVEEQKSAALDDRINELDRRLDESDRLNAVLQDTLMVLFERLEEFVAIDLPFLQDERGARLDFLRNDLVRPDVNGAEKLRRLLEALQVEANYGNSVEVDQQRIVVGDEEIFVDVLRLGRISAFWRTPDGQRVGEFDRATRQWVELPSKYRHQIGRAMEMASRMRPIEVISLPLGRIVP